MTNLRLTISRVITPQVISRTKIFLLRNVIFAKIFRLRYFSLNEIDKQLESYLDYDNGFFVECGANDGVNQSNTLFFEHFRGWHGILIEPYLPNFKALTRNRSPKNYFKHAACVGPGYKNQKVELIYSNLMTSTLNVKSDIPNPLDHANRGSKYWGGQAFVFEAPALSLNQILIEADAPCFIDLLSLDVEGVEPEILKSIDHSQFRFKYICVESRNPRELEEYLLSNNYQFVKQLSNHDCLFKSRDV